MPAEVDARNKAPEPLTEELLQRLLEASSPEAYLDETATDDRELSDYLYDLIEARGLSRAEVARASAVNATFVYQIFAGMRKVSRDNVIKLALGIGCSLRETQRLLRHAGVSGLWCKKRRDAIIIYCINQGMSLAQTDDTLYRMQEDTLVSAEG